MSARNVWHARWYCPNCGQIHNRLPSGLVNCEYCGSIGLRGCERMPRRVQCPHGCGLVGWDDGGVNDDLGRHLRREHAEVPS